MGSCIAFHEYRADSVAPYILVYQTIKVLHYSTYKEEGRRDDEVQSVHLRFSKPKIPSVPKLSKNQRRRAKQQMKKNPTGPNTASLKNVETIVFENPDVTSSIDGEVPKIGRGKREAQDSALPSAPEIDLKKARVEIVKFGINSMTGTEKYDAETAIAVSLGAKPEKRSYVNYKDLVAAKTEEKLKKVEEEKMNIKPKLKAKKSAKKPMSKRSRSDGIIKVNPAKFSSKGKSIGKRQGKK